ncbi:MAG: molybdopterin-binding protein [Hyphomicrobiales bacterium]|nr:molybdopterin-binding protein [Hyphomicrobiales bacterium]
MTMILPRRRFLTGLAASAATVSLGGCDQVVQNDSVRRVLRTAERLTMTTQRALLSQDALAREFSEADISPVFRANGTSMPTGEAYAELVDTQFRNWRLVIDGLVAKPLSLSLADLKALPARTQITRHDCVEGWSAIGKWAGVPLGLLLQSAGLAPNARYALFHCADEMEKTSDGSGQYYESIDLIDALHPQTILAYRLNGQDLPVANGAPLRLRVERQLGYKQAKYITRIEVIDSFATRARGKGGYWEDRGYEWYAGI